MHRATDEELKGMREESANVKHAAVSVVEFKRCQGKSVFCPPTGFRATLKISYFAVLG